MRSSRLGLLATALVFVVGCGNESGRAGGREDEERPSAPMPLPIGAARAALVDTDPVSAAVTGSCTTTSVAGLSAQLVDEIQCLHPGALKRLDGIAGITLGSAVFPYLQSPAVDALVSAQKARGVAMTVNSALRTLAQQYLLYRWYQTQRCGIGLAAAPGASNHESALAVDINDNAAWRDVMAAHDLRWLGASDPVHFDYIGAGRVELLGLSVLAFQRLWNRNHPDDAIAEDGDYGPATEARLSQSPVGGFTKGADCTQTVPPVDAGSPGDVPLIPDAPESPGAPPAGSGDGDGCAQSASPPSASLAALTALCLVFLRRRRRALARAT